MQGMTLGQLAEHVGGVVKGDPDIVITDASTLDKAGKGQITFLSNKKYEPQVKTTNANAVIVAKELESDASLLIAEDPYYAFMQIVVLLHGHREHKQVGISDKATVEKTATVGGNCNICDYVTISDNAEIGNDCYIYPGVFIGPNVKMGAGCIIYPNVVIYDETVIGDRVIVQANAVIGQDGFGFATHKGVHHKIPQIGTVIIEDDVEIGSCCVIERGTLDETILGAGTKLGDAGAIGHGAKLGPGCLIVPQVGIAGSATLGHHCVIGGQVGVIGHIKVGDMVTVGAKSGVARDVPDGATLLGQPAIEANKAKRIIAATLDLPDMRKKIKKLERALAKLQDQNS